METTFTCNASNYELQRAKLRELRGYYWALAVLVPAVLLYVYIFYLEIQEPFANDSKSFQLKANFATLVIMLIWALVTIWKKSFFYRNVRKKAISIDVELKRFCYHDTKQDATFYSGDIRRWIISTANEVWRCKPPRTEKDKFVLRDGRTFILEDAFNNEIHPFLVQHKQELSLPDPVTGAVKW